MTTSQKLSNKTTMATIIQQRLKLLKEEYSEPVLQQDHRFRSYCRQIARLYSSGCIQCHQALSPNFLDTELLQPLLGTVIKHPGILKTNVKI